MKRIAAILLIILAASSCVTQRKVDAWLDRHPLHEATRCADKFPSVVTGIDVKVDSAAFKIALDSILATLLQIDRIVDTSNPSIFYPESQGSLLHIDKYHGGITPDSYGKEITNINIPPAYPKDQMAVIRQQIAQLRTMLMRLPAVVIDTTRTVKDSAQIVKWKLTAQLYQDSSNYYKGQTVIFKGEADDWESRYKKIVYTLIGIGLIIGVVVFFVLKSKGLLSVPMKLFSKIKPF